MTRLSAIVSLIAGGLAAFTSPAAFAQDKSLLIEATIASEYVSKGVGRSDRDPHFAVQLQYPLASKTYAGVWAGTLGSPLGAEGESHLYLGWRPKAGAWTFDVRPMVKILAGAKSGEQTGQFEMRVDATRSVAGARLRLRAEHAPNGYGASRASTWIDAQVVKPVSPNWSLTGSLGRREQAVGRDYTGWSAGVQRKIGESATLDLRWIDTDAEAAGREYQGRAFASLSMRF